MTTAWQILKAEITKDTTPGTAGYLVEVSKAASLFMALQPVLRARDAGTNAFNADVEVSDAILNRGKLIAMGLMKE